MKKIPLLCCLVWMMGCGADDSAVDNCPNDENKTEPGTCGCGTAETDTDTDDTPDCTDACDNDPLKTAVGVCGCGTAESVDCGLTSAEFYTTRVWPIVQSKCLSCHNGQQQTAFDSSEPNSGRKANMIDRVSRDLNASGRMPKTPNEPLDSIDKAIFANW